MESPRIFESFEDFVNGINSTIQQTTSSLSKVILITFSQDDTVRMKKEFQRKVKIQRFYKYLFFLIKKAKKGKPMRYINSDQQKRIIKTLYGLGINDSELKKRIELISLFRSDPSSKIPPEVSKIIDRYVSHKKNRNYVDLYDVFTEARKLFKSKSKTTSKKIIFFYNLHNMDPPIAFPILSHLASNHQLTFHYDPDQPFPLFDKFCRRFLSRHTLQVLTSHQGWVNIITGNQDLNKQTKRYAVLTRHGLLHLKTNPTEYVSRRFFEIQSCSKDGPCSVEVRVADVNVGRLYLLCSTIDESNNWLKSLERVCKRRTKRLLSEPSLSAAGPSSHQARKTFPNLFTPSPVSRNRTSFPTSESSTLKDPSGVVDDVSLTKLFDPSLVDDILLFEVPKDDHDEKGIFGGEMLRSEITRFNKLLQEKQEDIVLPVRANYIEQGGDIQVFRNLKVGQAKKIPFRTLNEKTTKKMKLEYQKDFSVQFVRREERQKLMRKKVVEGLMDLFFGDPEEIERKKRLHVKRFSSTNGMVSSSGGVGVGSSSVSSRLSSVLGSTKLSPDGVMGQIDDLIRSSEVKKKREKNEEVDKTLTSMKKANQEMLDLIQRAKELEVENRTTTSEEEEEEEEEEEVLENSESENDNDELLITDSYRNFRRKDK